MDYEQLAAGLPPEITSDRLWRMRVYRLAAYMTHVAAEDARLLRRRGVGWGTIDQLVRAIGSIGATLAEGYSRSSGTDRVRFFEYSLGSDRESILWYLALRDAFLASQLQLRLDPLGEIRRLLLDIIPRERSRVIRPGGQRRGRDSLDHDALRSGVCGHRCVPKS